MKRMSVEEAAEWRRRSVEKYRATVRTTEKATRATRKRVRALTPQQERKRAEDAEYRRQRELRLVRARGRCEFGVKAAGFVLRCTVSAPETHHIKQRSTQVDHDVENLRALCATHHRFIHANPNWSEENGWIVREYRQMEGPE